VSRNYRSFCSPAHGEKKGKLTWITEFSYPYRATQSLMHTQSFVLSTSTHSTLSWTSLYIYHKGTLLILDFWLTPSKYLQSTNANAVWTPRRNSANWRRIKQPPPPPFRSFPPTPLLAVGWPLAITWSSPERGVFVICPVTHFYDRLDGQNVFARS